MIDHPLDRPIWSALTTRQAPLSIGGALARRYRPDVNVFAATADDGDEGLSALDDLLRPGERVYALQRTPMRAAGGLRIAQAEAGVQMWLRQAIARPDATPDATPDIGPVEGLTLADAEEMSALVAATNPGPFMPRTPEMGRFIGLRDETGRLIAMAGERMATPDFVEVSGVCVDPAYRGKGLAGRLSALVAARIQQEGRTPFLHAWQSNTAAIALYAKLGFELRQTMCVTLLEKAG